MDTDADALTTWAYRLARRSRRRSVKWVIYTACIPVLCAQIVWVKTGTALMTARLRTEIFLLRCGLWLKGDDDAFKHKY